MNTKPYRKREPKYGMKPLPDLSLAEVFYVGPKPAGTITATPSFTKPKFSVRKRRAKNKVARQSRKANRC